MADAHPRLLAAAGVAVAVLPTIFGLQATDHLRRDHDVSTAVVEAADAEVAITTLPALPRLAWRTTPPLTWLAAEADEVDALVGAVVAAGVDRVVVIGADEVDAPAGHVATSPRPRHWIIVPATG